MNTPIFSILLVNHRTLAFTRNCLDSIRNNSSENTYEIIVIDNDSNDKSLDYLRHQKDIKLFERKTGLKFDASDHGEGLDIGLRFAQAHYIVTLDTDVTIWKSDWLRSLATILEQEKAVLIGPSFYRNFIHPCLLMVKRETFDKYNLSFASKSYFHRFYDTAECLTSILKANNEKIIRLNSWIGYRESKVEDPIKGNNTERWVKEWWPLAARHGVFIGGIAHHAFYGTRILNSNRNDYFCEVKEREINYTQIKSEIPKYPTTYSILIDSRNTLAKLKSKLLFLTKASNWLVLKALSQINKYFKSYLY